MLMGLESMVLIVLELMMIYLVQTQISKSKNMPPNHHNHHPIPTNCHLTSPTPPSQYLIFGLSKHHLKIVIMAILHIG